MTERMTDERMAEIESRRLRTSVKSTLPEGEGYPADSSLTYELLQALKAEREYAERLSADNEKLDAMLLVAESLLVDQWDEYESFLEELNHDRKRPEIAGI